MRNCEALRFATSLRIQPSAARAAPSALRSFTLRNFIEESSTRTRVEKVMKLRSFTLRNFIEDPFIDPYDRSSRHCEALRFATSLRSACGSHEETVVPHCEALRFATSLRTAAAVADCEADRAIAKLYASQLH